MLDPAVLVRIFLVPNLGVFSKAPPSVEAKVGVVGVVAMLLLLLLTLLMGDLSGSEGIVVVLLVVEAVEMADGRGVVWIEARGGGGGGGCDVGEGVEGASRSKSRLL